MLRSRIDALDHQWIHPSLALAGAAWAVFIGG
jgi:hypothetical protein